MTSLVRHAALEQHWHLLGLHLHSEVLTTPLHYHHLQKMRRVTKVCYLFETDAQGLSNTAKLDLSM